MGRDRRRRPDAMVGFLREVPRLEVRFAEPTTVELTTTEGDAVQIMGPGDPYHTFFRRHATGPVPLFEVDDVRAARTELEAAGVEIVGELDRDDAWEWFTSAPSTDTSTSSAAVSI